MSSPASSTPSPSVSAPSPAPAPAPAPAASVKKEKKKGAEKFSNVSTAAASASSASTVAAPAPIPFTEPGKKKDLSGEMALAYHPHVVEDSWDKWWESQGFYQPKDSTTSPPTQFVMVIPPPNVTGTLHLGHALMVSIQDCLTRYHRMLGKRTLWLPGTDHAGIATQTVVEKKIMREQQKTRHDLGREEFLREVYRWKDNSGNKIYAQFRKMGTSVDWSRDAFTMDPKLSAAVKEAFIRLHAKGLIYRANRIVSWCCALRTAISSIEVETRDFEGSTLVSLPGYSDPVEVGVIHSFTYKAVDEEGRECGEITVATTRIETMLGDVAVAVSSKDPRYTHLVGKRLVHPFIPSRVIKVITDDVLVDMAFGTGAVKVTPAHDPNDFKCGERNGLESITIFDDDGKINEFGGKFCGMKRFDARTAVIEELKALGLYKGKENNKMAIGFCSRSKDMIEPIVKPQWWVNCQNMAARAVAAVREGELVLVPSEFNKVWYQWLENIQDWCISRQLWWGHRIPAYRVTFRGETAEQAVDDERHWVVANTEEEGMAVAAERFPERKGDIVLTQDEDVLDTWFSSGTFPFSTMGWPSETEDFSRFYPGDLLETGHDILFFWVARMVMMGQELTGKLPFKTVYLHALVRDRQGQKMSKSKGNVIDPMDVINGITLSELHAQLAVSNLDPLEISRATEGQKREFPEGIAACGADALRFGLLSYTSQGRDINMDIQKIVVYRQFCNKIWQATRFGLLNFDKEFVRPQSLEEVRERMNRVPEGNTFGDRWILSRLHHTVLKANEALTAFNLAEAAMAIHSFWLYELCDVYLELIKPIVRAGTGTAEGATATEEEKEAKAISLSVLYLCFDHGLRLLHPLMPFITEELYNRMPGFKGEAEGSSVPISIMTSSYPLPSSTVLFYDQTIEDRMRVYQEIGKSARSTRSSLNLTKKRVDCVLVCSTSSLASQLNEKGVARDIATLCVANKVEAVSSEKGERGPLGSINTVINGEIELFIPLKGLVDFSTELFKLEKNMDNLSESIEKGELKMTLPGWEKSSAEMKLSHQAKLVLDKEELIKLKRNYNEFQSLLDENEKKAFVTEKNNLLNGDLNKVLAQLDKLRVGQPEDETKIPKKVLARIEETRGEIEKIKKKIEKLQSNQ